MKVKKTKPEKERPKNSKKTTDLQQKVDELTTDLQRLQADFINYRRRSESEQNHVMAIAKESVITQLLPLLDNIERAFSHLPKELKDNSWAQGVSKIARQTEAVLKDFGVEKIQALGQIFDPSTHEAVGMEEGEGDQEVVIEELQSGYKMGDRVLRPSMVRVGKIQESKGDHD